MKPGRKEESGKGGCKQEEGMKAGRLDREGKRAIKN